MMRSKSLLTAGALVAGLMMGKIPDASAQAPSVQTRIPQQVTIGGLRVDAALVLAPGGGVQSYSCPGPQQYITTDGSSQGWACFDPTTNVWLLSALPPQQEQAPAPAPVIVQPVIRQPVIQQVVQQPIYATPVVYQYPVVQPTVIYRPEPRVVYAA